jgi:hypothetical protein
LLPHLWRLAAHAKIKCYAARGIKRLLICIRTIKIHPKRNRFKSSSLAIRESFKIKIKDNEPCGSIFPECFLLRSVRAGCIAPRMHVAIAKSFSRDAHAEATAQTILSSPQATN